MSRPTDIDRASAVRLKMYALRQAEPPAFVSRRSFGGWCCVFAAPDGVLRLANVLASFTSEKAAERAIQGAHAR